MSFDFDIEGYYDESEARSIVEEASEKLKDSIISYAKNEIRTILDENEALKNTISSLQTKLASKEDERRNNYFGDIIINSIIDKPIPERIKLLDTILSNMFEPTNKESQHNSMCSDFNNSYGWFILYEKYYDHKDIVIDMLETLKIPLKTGNFNLAYCSLKNDYRLPCDWTVNELKIFLSTLQNHFNTNGNFFENNLCWYFNNFFNPIKKQCETQYSNIPWQLILKNPNLLNEEILVLVGKNICKPNSKFAHVEDYQKITDKQFNIIASQFDMQAIEKSFKDKNTYLANFIIRHLKSIEDSEMQLALLNLLVTWLPYIVASNEKEYGIFYKFDFNDFFTYMVELNKSSSVHTREIIVRNLERFSIEQQNTLFKFMYGVK